MNEFESDWISLSQSQGGVRVFWVNLREDNKVSQSKMTVSEFKMAEFKMATIIKLSQNESVKFFFCAKWWKPSWQNSRWLTLSSWVRMNEFESDWISLSQSFVQNGWIQDGRIEQGCHHQVEWSNEWVQFYLFKMVETKIEEFKMAAIIKFSQNELVWVRLN